MRSLYLFLRAHWQEALIFGVAVPLILWAITMSDWLPAVLVTVVTLMSVVTIYELKERVETRRMKKMSGENLAFQTRRRALIFTVGKQTATIVFALNRQAPEFVGMICSTETESYARQVLADSHWAEDKARVHVVDPSNILELRAQTTALLEWLRGRGVTPREIAVDVTGGMTTMSLAVFSVAADREVDSQYVISKYDTGNKIIEGSQDAIFIMRYLRGGE